MSKVVIYSTLNFYLDTIHGFYFNKKKLRQQIILEWKLELILVNIKFATSIFFVYYFNLWLGMTY